MFEPDKFSDSNPKWILINHNNALSPSLIEFIKREYSSLLGDLRSIYSASALELNSKNILAVGKHGKIVIKLISETTREDFERKAEIYKIIAVNRLPSVEIIGAFFEPFEKQTSLITSHYYPGNYYSGSAQEFVLVFSELKNLLENFPRNKLNLFHRHYPYPDDANEVVADFFQSVSNSENNLSGETLKLLKIHEDTIIKANLFAGQFSSRIDEIEDSLGHIDLHPHNIIIQDNKVTLLDVDALMLSKWPLHFGFGVFKLLRQSHVSKNTVIDREGLERIISSLSFGATNDFKPLDLIFMGAKWEIMRRIQIIMKGNLGGGQSLWNSVLPIQIKALQEVNFLRDYYC